MPQLRARTGYEGRVIDGAPMHRAFVEVSLDGVVSDRYFTDWLPTVSEAEEAAAELAKRVRTVLAGRMH